MKMLPFTNEGDLRRWLRVRFHDRIFWIEPAAGSTMGMPDCVVALDDGRSLFIEAKLGKFKQRTNAIEFTVRAEQRRVIERMRELGVPVLGLVAVQGTPDLYVCKPTQAFLDGWLDLGGRTCGHEIVQRGRVLRHGSSQELKQLSRMLV